MAAGYPQSFVRNFERQSTPGPTPHETTTRVFVERVNGQVVDLNFTALNAPDLHVHHAGVPGGVTTITIYEDGGAAWEIVITVNSHGITHNWHGRGKGKGKGAPP